MTIVRQLYFNKDVKKKKRKWKSHNHVQIKQYISEQPMVKEETKMEIKKKNLETHEKRITTCQNVWDTVKAILRGKL